MKISLLSLLFVVCLMGLGLGQEAAAEKSTRRKSLWGRIARPVKGLFQKGKSVVGGLFKSVGNRAKKAAEDTAEQKSNLKEGVDAVMGALDEVAEEASTKAGDAKDSAVEAVAEQTATGAERAAAAEASAQEVVNDASEVVSKGEDATVEVINELEKQAVEAVDQAEALTEEEGQEAAAASKEL